MIAIAAWEQQQQTERYKQEQQQEQQKQRHTGSRRQVDSKLQEADNKKRHTSADVAAAKMLDWNRKH